RSGLPHESSDGLGRIGRVDGTHYRPVPLRDHGGRRDLLTEMVAAYRRRGLSRRREGPPPPARGNSAREPSGTRIRTPTRFTLRSPRLMSRQRWTSLKPIRAAASLTV